MSSHTPKTSHSQHNNTVCVPTEQGLYIWQPNKQANKAAVAPLHS